MAMNDSVSFNDLVQVPDGNKTGEICSATSWSMTNDYGSGPVSGVSLQISPTITGAGDWDCGREDVVTVTITTGTLPTSFLTNYDALGAFTFCLPGVNCSNSPAPEIGGDWWISPLSQKPSPSPTPLSTPAGAGGGDEIPTPAATPSPLYIYDKNLNKIVSDGARYNTVIGKQMSIEIGPTPATSPQFGIAGNTIAGQTFSNSFASYTTLGNLNVQDITFYWIRPNSVAVSGSAMVNGTMQTTYAMYNIEAPNVTTMQATFATPVILNSPEPFLELGDNGNLPASAGVTMQLAAQMPPDFGGYFAETQLVDANPTSSPAASPPYPATNGQYWSDACAFYMVQTDAGQLDPISLSKGASASWTTYDAPNYGLWGHSIAQLNVNDGFKDYFVYRPSGANNVWVGVKEIDWRWGGTATLSSTWTLSSPISPTTQNGGATSGTLSWPQNLNSSDCPNIPTN